MSLLEGILNCQWMEAKAFQNGEAVFGWFAREIHPKETAPVSYQFREFLWGNVFSNGLSWRVVKRTDHKISRIL
jgi:hypothetical protein